MKKFKNNKQNVDTWVGQEIQPGSYYEIQAFELSKWQNDSKVLADIGSGNGIINDGSVDITDVAKAINYLIGNIVEISKQPNPSPFASKTVGTKNIFKRVHGVQQAVNIGQNDVIYVIPYPWCKINGLEIINGESLDTVCLYVLDSSTGTYTTVPNYILNQFGFSVNVGKDLYIHKSEFDADLYLNMQLKIVYNSVSAKTVGFNFILNEVK